MFLMLIYSLDDHLLQLHGKVDNVQSCVTFFKIIYEIQIKTSLKAIHLLSIEIK
jgi:hypothetical protein